MEMGGSRIIPLDGGPHISDSIRQQHGNSRGHWDGDTLVVETTNYAPTSYFMGSGADLHLVDWLETKGHSYDGITDEEVLIHVD